MKRGNWKSRKARKKDIARRGNTMYTYQNAATSRPLDLNYIQQLAGHLVRTAGRNK